MLNTSISVFDSEAILSARNRGTINTYNQTLQNDPFQQSTLDSLRDCYRDQLRDSYRDYYRDQFRDNFGGLGGFGFDGFGNNELGGQVEFGGQGFDNGGFGGGEGYFANEEFGGGETER